MRLLQPTNVRNVRHSRTEQYITMIRACMDGREPAAQQSVNDVLMTMADDTSINEHLFLSLNKTQMMMRWSLRGKGVKMGCLCIRWARQGKHDHIFRPGGTPPPPSLYLQGHQHIFLFQNTFFCWFRIF